MGKTSLMTDIFQFTHSYKVGRDLHHAADALVVFQSTHSYKVGLAYNHFIHGYAKSISIHPPV